MYNHFLNLDNLLLQFYLKRNNCLVISRHCAKPYFPITKHQACLAFPPISLQSRAFPVILHSRLITLHPLAFSCTLLISLFFILIYVLSCFVVFSYLHVFSGIFPYSSFLTFYILSVLLFIFLFFLTRSLFSSLCKYPFFQIFTQKARCLNVCKSVISPLLSVDKQYLQSYYDHQSLCCNSRQAVSIVSFVQHPLLLQQQLEVI